MKGFLFSLALEMATTLADAQGTIQILNNPGTRFRVNGGIPSCGDLGPCPGGEFHFGVFAGLSPDGLSSQPVLPLATDSFIGGLIRAQNEQAYSLPNFGPGSNVFLQIRGWESRFGADWQRGRDEGVFGQTAVLPFVLGPANGPGTVIWSATDLTKFQAINLVPEPSTFVLASLGFFSAWLFRLSARNQSR